MRFNQHASSRYLTASLWCVVLLTAATLVTGYAIGRDIVGAAEIAAIFSVVSAAAYSLLWYIATKGGGANMVRFHLTATALRIMAALVVVAAYCLIVRERTAIIQFAVVFLTYYVVMLAFDTVYLTRKKTE